MAEIDVAPELMRDGRLVGGRCDACGTFMLGLPQLCPGCWREGTVVPTALSSTGTLYSSTMIRRAPKGFVAPYRMGWVDLPEGLRVIGRIEGEPAEPGVAVALERGELGRAENGDVLMGPVFRVKGDR